MTTHRGKHDVQHHGCWALGNHATGLKSNRTLFRELGAVDAVLNAMEDAVTVVDVQDQVAKCNHCSNVSLM